MASVSVSVEAPSTPEAVWELLSDLNRWEEWLTIHQGWRSELPAELKAGSQFTEVVSVMNMTNKIEWTVEEVEAPKFLTISGNGIAGVKIEFTLKVEGAGDQTKASFDAKFSGSMIVGPIGKAVAKHAAADLRESMDKFIVLLG